MIELYDAYGRKITKSEKVPVISIEAWQRFLDSALYVSAIVCTFWWLEVFWGIFLRVFKVMSWWDWRMLS